MDVVVQKINIYSIFGSKILKFFHVFFATTVLYSIFILSEGQNPLQSSLPQNNALDDSDQPLPEKVEAFEKALIMQALEKTEGSIKDALDILHIPRKTLSDKMKKYDIDRGDFVNKG